MRKNQLWLIVSGLILLNCLTVIFFLSNESSEAKDEVVATIGAETITRQDWLNVLEKSYGRETLKKMIDEKVIEQIARKYNVTISDLAVEREMLLLKTMYGTTSDDSQNEEEWEKQIKSSLLLEEILTKDVVIPEEELKKFYEENKNLYEIKPSYHISQIVVSTQAEAQQAVQELKEGSSFSALARERSIDSFSAAQGGDLGFIQEGEGLFPNDYLTLIDGLRPGEWTDPLPLEEGFAIFKLHEKMDGKEYSFPEVKEEIRRVIALDQMKGQANLDIFWEELKVEWFYGE